MSDKLDALVEQIGNLTMQEAADMAKTVSYTHLTLPATPYV